MHSDACSLRVGRCTSEDTRAKSNVDARGGGRQRIDYMAMLGLVRAATLRRQLIDAISPQCGAYKGQPRMENESPPRKENFNYRLTDGFGLPWGKRCSSTDDDESLRESRPIGTRSLFFVLIVCARRRTRKYSISLRFCECFHNDKILFTRYHRVRFNKIIFLLHAIVLCVYCTIV